MIIGYTKLDLTLICLFLVVIAADSTILNNAVIQKNAQKLVINDATTQVLINTTDNRIKTKKKVFKTMTAPSCFIFYQVEYRTKQNKNQNLRYQNISVHRIQRIPYDQATIKSINQNLQQTDNVKPNQILQVRTDSMSEILYKKSGQSKVISIQQDINSNNGNDQFLGYHPKVSYSINKKVQKTENNNDISRIQTSCHMVANIYFDNSQLQSCGYFSQKSCYQKQNCSNKRKTNSYLVPIQLVDQQVPNLYYITRHIQNEFTFVQTGRLLDQENLTNLVIPVPKFQLNVTQHIFRKYFSLTKEEHQNNIKISEITTYDVSVKANAISFGVTGLSKQQLSLVKAFQSIPDIKFLKLLVQQAQIISVKILQTIKVDYLVYAQQKLQGTFILLGETVEFI